jgi:hypothetical protein
MSEAIKVSKAGWPRCNEVHSPENRTGQAWKPGRIQVMASCGTVTKIFEMEHGLFDCRKPGCAGIVRIDERGVAACEICGDIYNDGIHEEPVKIKSKITTRSFIYKAFNKVE